MLKETFNTLEELLSKFPKIGLGRTQDYTDKKVGRITFVCRVKKKDKNTNWALKCDCGKYFVGRSSDVMHEYTVSCGCAYVPHFKAVPPMKDITNQRFGKLIAIKPVGSSKSRECIDWLCKCDCGNTTIVHSTMLRSGNTKSCGCSRKPSSYELKVMDWLNAHGLTFFREVRVAELGQLRFDFKVLLQHDQYCFIEVQGQYHYRDMPGYVSENEFKLQQEHDERKARYCAVNNIPFLRIAYNEDMEAKLQQFFSTLTFNDQSKDVGPSGSKREGK